MGGARPRRIVIPRHLREAVDAARAAGRLLLGRLEGSLTVGHKSTRADLVSDADRAAESLIVRRLLRSFPDADILAEEETRRDTGAPHRWIIDPLDGTVNFVHGFPLFSVSIALEVRGRIQAGVVHLPRLGETFTAVRGKGAWRNGRRIRVSTTRRLRDSLLATGFPYFDEGRKRNLRYFGGLLTKTQAIRRVGSAAIDLCFTACGIFDGFWEFALKPWDIAAGMLIVREAGGRATAFDGGPVVLETGEILASNGRIHREMAAVLAELGRRRAPWPRCFGPNAPP